MFKKIIIIASIICITACAQMQTAKPEDLEYSAVHQINGLSKDELFTKTQSWFAVTFVDSKSVLELQDKENGRIIGKGMTEFYNAGIAQIPTRFTMIIDFKDNKIRTQYKSWTGMWGQARNQPMPVKVVANALQVKKNIIALDQKFAEYLNTQNKGTDDW